MAHHIPARASKVEWFRKHLRTCPHVSEAVRAQADADSVRSKHKSAQSALMRLQREVSHQENIAPATLPLPAESTSMYPAVSIPAEPSMGTLSQSNTTSVSQPSRSRTASMPPCSMEERVPEVDWDRWIGEAEAAHGVFSCMLCQTLI